MILMRDFSDLRFLVYGDVMLDEYIHGSINRISPEAPVPIFEETTAHRVFRPGGAANVMANLVALGAQVILVTVTGFDTAGSQIMNLTQGVGQYNPIQVIPRRTTRKIRYMVHNRCVFRRDIEDRHPLEQSQEAVAIGELEKILATKPHGVIVSDYAKGCVTPAILKVLGQHERVFIDPKRPFEFYRPWGDFITPNLHELLTFTGKTSVADAAECAASQSGARILVTMGDRGMRLYGPELTASVPGMPVPCVDPCGAGDTALAAFACSICAGYEPQLAVEVANTAAGLSVTKPGAATVSYREVSEAMK